MAWALAKAASESNVKDRIPNMVTIPGCDRTG